jgi:hypothetical protein
MSLERSNKQSRAFWSLLQRLYKTPPNRQVIHRIAGCLKVKKGPVSTPLGCRYGPGGGRALLVVSDLPYATSLSRIEVGLHREARHELERRQKRRISVPVDVLDERASAAT